MDVVQDFEWLNHAGLAAHSEILGLTDLTAALQNASHVTMRVCGALGHNAVKFTEKGTNRAHHCPQSTMAHRLL
jgi:hypothetical protein